MRRSSPFWAILFTAGFALAACDKNFNINKTAKLPDEQARFLIEGAQNAIISIAEDSQVGHIFLENLRNPDIVGIIITPNMVKGGLFFGGSGGSGLVMGRADNGEWSYPTFIQQGSGSFGLQLGFQSAQVATVLTSNNQLQAMLDGSPIAGGEAGGSVIDEGAGFDLASAIDFSAPLRTYTVTRGAFVGIDAKLGGIWTDKKLNTAFYADPQVTPSGIVLEARYKNAFADGLRNLLLQYHSGS